MNYSTVFVKVIFLIFFLGKISLSFSQEGTVSKDQYQAIDTLIYKYEQQKELRIFFKPEWFESKQLHVSALNLPHDAFLSKLAEISKCSLITLDSSTYVLVLSDVMPELLAKNEAHTAKVIGNIQEYGKYKRATFSGKVLDGKNGEPLPGARIYIKQLKTGTSSDKFGNYSLNIPVGVYDVELFYVGYEETVQKVRLVSTGHADFEIYEKSINLTEVTVTSSKSNRNISSTQMSLINLDANLIKELPSTLGEVDVLKSIALLPGIQSSGELGTGFYVRGGGADQNLILLEGIPIFNSSHLFGLTSVINPDAITNITLYKAGIPAKYGERASSVMDVQLGGSNQEKTSVRGGIGIINSKIHLDIPIAKNRARLILGGRTTYSDWLLHKMDDVDLKNSSAGFSDINGMLLINVNNNNRISFFGYHSYDNLNIKNAEGNNYTNSLISMRWNHIFSSELFSSLIVGSSKYEYNMNENDSIQKGKSYRIKSSLLYKTLKFNVTWIPSDIHSLDIGLSGVMYSEKPGTLNPFDEFSFISPVELPSEKAIEYAAYASDNINITEKLGAEIGLRYSVYNNLGPAEVFIYKPFIAKSPETIIDTLHYGHNKKVAQFSGLEPRVSIRYLINENSSIKASYNRTNQYINLVSNSTVMNPADLWKLSNRYIKPLKCDQYALGYYRNFKQNMVEASLEVYYKKLENIIEYKDGASLMINPLLDADLLNAKGYNYGIELYAKKNSGRLTGWFTYSYSISMRRTNGKTEQEQVNRNTYFPSIYDRPHNLNIIGNYHISKRWRFNFAFSYSTGRPVTLPEYKYSAGGQELVYYSDRNEYRLPDYHRLDISITRDESIKIKKFWKGSWTFSIVNVYGRKNLYSSYFQKENSNYSLYAMYIIGHPLPMLIYNFTF